MHGLRTALFTIAAAAISTSAQSKSVQDNVYALAFNPERNFWGDIKDDHLMLSILYRGDDYDVPVYSLSIAKVGKRFLARIVRSKKLETDERPRQAGYRLMSQIVSANATTDSKLKSLLDAGAVDWLEADLENCPNVVEAVAAVRSADWSVAQSFEWNSKFGSNYEEPSIVIHADTVEVKQFAYRQEVQYDGWFKGGQDHVTTAVLHLQDALEPCWVPATSKVPWNRKKPKN